VGPILACGDTNAAVDNIVEGLAASGLSVVRLGAAAKVCAGRRERGRGLHEGGNAVCRVVCVSGAASR
jgi:hypothetical protein